jgi:dCMP deaminase
VNYFVCPDCPAVEFPPPREGDVYINQFCLKHDPAVTTRDALWDRRFLELAGLVASWSKDPSTKTGAVITRPDRTVVSLGYNGFPRKMPDVPAYLQEREEKYSRIIHCEINALLTAREPVAGYTLYTWPFLSCDRCFVQLAQAGITRFVAPQATTEQLARWGPSFAKVRQYAEEMDIELKEYLL